MSDKRMNADELQMQIHQRLIEKLSESETKFKTICDSALDAIVMTDDHAKVVFWNHAAERIFAYSPSEADGKPLQSLIVPFDQRHEFSKYYSFENPDVGILVTFSGIDKHENTFPLEVSISSIFLNASQHFIWVIRDISKRKKLEETQKELEKEKDQRLKSLGIMAGGMAHDFNNLLLPIIGNIEFLIEGANENSDVRQRLDSILDASLQASRLSRQMLSYSGSRRLDSTVSDLSTVISKMEMVLRSCVVNHVYLYFDLKKNLVPVEIDVTEIEQVLLNMVINASDAMTSPNMDADFSGDIYISTMDHHIDATYLHDSHCADDVKPGHYVSFTIKDKGCGMSLDVQNRLFDPFFTTKFTGRGLGMSAVLGIVHGHNGVLHIDSVEGEGTCFTVSFPASSQEIQPDMEEVVDLEAMSFSGVVLIIDDDEAVSLLLKMRLEALGCSCLQARNGLEGLEVYQAHEGEIDLVILDMTMPVMDGAECFDKLRLINPYVKVVLSSGYAKGDLKGHFASNALAGFLPKPYKMQQLREILYKILVL